MDEEGADLAQPFDGCWLLYEQAKAAFLANHPGASPEDIEQALRRAAEDNRL